VNVGGRRGFDLQGHRGARGLLPENTIPSFVRAVELGVDTVELDVVVTRDDQLVASHEPWFDERICSTPEGQPVRREDRLRYRIYDLTYDEVAAFDCGARGHPLFPRQQPIAVSKPLLHAAIAAVDRRSAELGRPPARFNIETKSRPEWDGQFTPPADKFACLLLDEIRGLGVLDRTMVQSFDVRTLQAAKRIEPGVMLSLLVENRDGLEANLAALGFLPDVYSPDYRLLDARSIAEIHRRGMVVIPWTVNTASEMQRLRDLGVDGLITDYPDIGRQVFPLNPKVLP